METLYSVVSRVMFFGAFALLALSLVEAAVNFSGYTILQGSYSKGRLVELAAVLLIFVIALLLRQIRQELREPRRG